MLAVHFFETSLGQMGVAWSPNGVYRFRLPCVDDASAWLSRVPGASALNEMEPDHAVADLVARVQAHAAGHMKDFRDVELDWSRVSASDRRVYERLREVDHGRTLTYGELARLADAPGGALGVGQIMARNPWPLLVPCHRVLGANGRLVGFSAPGGVKTKIRLLQLEAAVPPGDARQGCFAF